MLSRFARIFQIAFRERTQQGDLREPRPQIVVDVPRDPRPLGFQRVPHGKIVMPGPVDPDRLLYHELIPGAFAATSGKMRRV